VITIIVVIASSCKNNYIVEMTNNLSNGRSPGDPGQNSDVPGIIQLDSYWPYQITVLADRVSRRTSRIVKAQAGLNLSQWRVLAAIAETPGRTSAEVVTVTPMDKGLVSRATKTLLEMGLLLREASQDDGRVSYLYLTERGYALYQTLIPDVSGVLERAAATLSDNQQTDLSKQLGQLLKVIPDQR
jgi:DNA-binding MarR family transcriptional regulator